MRCLGSVVGVRRGLMAVAATAGLAGSASLTIGGPLDLSAAPVVASSQENTTHVTRNAFDGNSSTRWSSARTDPQWLYVDLGLLHTLNQVTIDWETAAGKDYQLYVTANSTAPDPNTALSSWTQIASVTGRTGVVGAGPAAADDTFDFDAGTFTANAGSAESASVSINPQARYLMMYGTSRATIYGYSIREEAVSATPVPEPGALGVIAVATIGLLRRRRRH